MGPFRLDHMIFREYFEVPFTYKAESAVEVIQARRIMRGGNEHGEMHGRLSDGNTRRKQVRLLPVGCACVAG